MLAFLMDRSELERLDRDTLIAHAERSGVPRARILTRPELVDELLTRAGVTRPDEMVRVRGLFGRARDLLTRVIERGLHLPDAAERIRERLSIPPLAQEPPLPTVTLAEIYAAQGHRDRAIATLKDVLAREPDHAAARALIERLLDASYAGPEAPPLPPEDEILSARSHRETRARELEEDRESDPDIIALDDDDEDVSLDDQTQETEWGRPASARDDGDEADDAEEDEAEEDELEDGAGSDEEEASPLPARLDRARREDECVAIPVDLETLFVHWDVTEQTRGHLERARPGAALVLRALVVAPTWDGPASSVRDVAVSESRGDTMLEELPAGAVVRTAIGWRIGEDVLPIAHSPALEALEIDAAGAVRTVARWTLRGFSHVDPDDRDAGAIERAFEAIRERARA